MQVVYLSAARRALKAMPLPDASALVAKLAVYADTGVGDVKKLTGEPRYRLRHGNWRAVFEIAGDVIVVRIAHRRDVYR